MAKKSNKSAWKRQQEQIAAEKRGDVDLYSVFVPESNRQIYPGDGIPLEDAQRMARGLVFKADVRRVKEARKKSE